MVEAPLGFFEMKDEVFGPNAAKFCHAQLGEAPKAFDAVDVVFAAGKFIFVVMNAMMFIAVENKAVVALPAVGIDGGGRKHLTFYNRHQLLFGAVCDDLGEHFSATLEQADDGRFASRPTAPFSAHSPRTKIAFVHFDFACHRPGFFHRQLQNPQSQSVVKALHCLHTQPTQPRRRQRRNVRTKQLQYCPEFYL